ncbi:Cof-type HAD-IIB family hydrolase [Oceanobacillus sp. Castelsardo]|uniref:Cof-type HAD-IIB family hydrolase n=1 Tax=Oceanobacillus sp. Castelsardo TaxID=1851204 RepID=UPI0008399D50|nr:Cof-type HAD-IIB family hydrolase [Oceanobacillus sp. Castelsardo]
MKGFVFFDLDGTLLNNKSDVDPNVIKVIDDLEKNDYEPIIATGRTVFEVRHIMEKTGISSIISMNGQSGIYRGKEVFEKTMDVEILKRLKDMALSRNEHVAFYNAEKIGITGHNDTARKAYELIHEAVPNINGSLYEDEKINMVLVLSEIGDKEYKAAFPELSFIRNGPASMDVIPKGGSKAAGIKTFLETLKIGGLPTYAFGDGLNDIEMFELVDYGIAMGNARDALKEKASYVTETNMNNGIEQGLKHYNLI